MQRGNCEGAFLADVLWSANINLNGWQASVLRVTGRPGGRAKAGRVREGGEAASPLGSQQAPAGSSQGDQSGRHHAESVTTEIRVDGCGTVGPREEERLPRPGGKRKYQALMAAAGRHKIAMVGVQEHHWQTEQDWQEARRYLERN